MSVTDLKARDEEGATSGDTAPPAADPRREKPLPGISALVPAEPPSEPEAPETVTVPALLAQIEAKLPVITNTDVQYELGRVINLFPRLETVPAELWRPYAVLAVKALLAATPNLQLAQTVRNDLERLAARRARGLTGWMARTIGQSPAWAVLCGTMVTLIVSFHIYLAGTWLLGTFGTLRETVFPIDEISPLFMGAFFGSIISILGRLDRFAVMTVYDPLLLFVNACTKPFVAIVFALAVYAILKAGIIQLPQLSNDIDGKIYFLFVIGFLAGFSERFARDVVTQAEDRFVGIPPTHADKAKPPK